MSTTDTAQAPAGDNRPESGRRRVVSALQATFQSVQQRFRAATKNIEPPAILVPSYVVRMLNGGARTLTSMYQDPFVKIGERVPVDDRKNDVRDQSNCLYPFLRLTSWMTSDRKNLGKLCSTAGQVFEGQGKDEQNYDQAVLATLTCP